MLGLILKNDECMCRKSDEMVKAIVEEMKEQ